jgi:hypothetical protein
VGKIFTCLFGFSGIALLGAIVASVGSNLVSLEVEAVQKVQMESRKSLMRVYDVMPKILHRTKNASSAEEKIQIYQEVKEEVLAHNTSVKGEKSLPFLLLSKPLPLTSTIWRTVQWVGKSLMVVVVGGFLIGWFEGWSTCDSIYYSIVTATT